MAVSQFLAKAWKRQFLSIRSENVTNRACKWPLIT